MTSTTTRRGQLHMVYRVKGDNFLPRGGSKKCAENNCAAQK